MKIIYHENLALYGTILKKILILTQRNLSYCYCNNIFLGVNSQYTVTIVSSPAGTSVSGSTNTFDYPILSTVTLTCRVTTNNGLPCTVTSYQWNTAGCYTNSKFTPSNPQCFPHGQTTQTVTGNDLKAEDAGTITCTATISDSEYTSEPFTLRISGEQLVYCVVTFIMSYNTCYYYLLHGKVVYYIYTSVIVVYTSVIVVYTSVIVVYV